jgi:pimeloyl-ACP methyl ester carboxylesterase
VARLRGSYQVVAVDLPGQGRSRGSADAAHYYLAPMLAVLENVASDLGLDSVALLGYSFGGALALQAAALLDLRQLRCPGLLYLSPDDAATAADLLASLGDAAGSSSRCSLRAHVEPGLDHESVFEQSQRALDRIEPFLAGNIW